MSGRKNKKLLLVVGIIGLFLLGCIAFMKSSFFEVRLAQTEMHLELGTTPESNPAYYLKGEDWCVALSWVDTSEVKKKQTGRYPIFIYHGFETYTCYVNVTDTTAPEVSCDIKNKTVTPGEIVSVHNLGLHIKDYSEIDSVAFTRIASNRFYTGLPEEDTVEMRKAYEKGLEMYAEEFQFAFGGIYTLNITVKDIFHNSSDITLTLKVEEPPVIETPGNYYIAIAEKIVFENYITVWDFIDEDLDIEDVKIDTSQLQTGKTGTYPVIFSATDSYGLKNTTEVNVHVNTKEELQELINTHQIHANEDVIIGAYNLYDSGYYETEDLTYIQSQILPAVVNVENDVLETVSSGFIIALDDAFVTIATNEHSITDDMMTDITFYDGSKYIGTVVAADKIRDIAFIRIPIDGKSQETSISSDYAATLRTVHINEAYWKSLSNDSDIGIGYICIDTDGDVWQTKVGTMLEKVAVRTWNEYENINEMIISPEPVAGSSGSAIFDGYGHLIGMIRGYTDYYTYIETVAVPLNEILEYYEWIFKEKVQYQ